MAIFRQYIAPFLIVLVFLVALLAVSSRIFLPSDLAAPAPIEDTHALQPQAKLEIAIGTAKSTATDTATKLPPSLSTLIKGVTDDFDLVEQL
ncbi:hypothetical protein ACN4EK_21465 [Pantanalinema rosaneae CENA516]|uniref:hypothetical protein n=1 Tax=Pantanalinema rosaneae TaxID=1620701 RepID=UPI003D6EE882